MKVGILTVPFNNNYGGFLQAFALKTVIQDMGHEVIFINRRRNRSQGLKSKIGRILKRWHIISDERQKSIKRISVNTDKFKEEYLSPITDEYYTHNSLKKCTELGIDCFIVGSDQVWRYQYAVSSIDDFFFSFLDEKNLKRFSYAASFGTDTLDYPQEKKKQCSELLKKFNAISVRETSGLTILKEMGITGARVVLDPTLLLDKQYYISNLAGTITLQKERYLLKYILDTTEEKNAVVKDIAAKIGLKIVEIKAQTGNIAELPPLPPIQEWLSLINNAAFVVTDSFHGTVFSILFNIPFLVYGNKDRGFARFHSLLNTFSLESRFIESEEDLDKVNIAENIKWQTVNEILQTKREVSYDFLAHQLSTK